MRSLRSSSSAHSALGVDADLPGVGLGGSGGGGVALLTGVVEHRDVAGFALALSGHGALLGCGDQPALGGQLRAGPEGDGDRRHREPPRSRTRTTNIRPTLPTGAVSSPSTVELMSERLFAPVSGATHQTFGPVEIDIAEVGDARIKRSIYPAGMRWSTDLGPLVGTDLCMHAHAGFLVHGSVHFEYADGCAVDLTAPAVLDVAPGHDAWVVGDEPGGAHRGRLRGDDHRPPRRRRRNTRHD